MGCRKYRDIEIGDVVYPDAQAVADALGVTAGHVRNAIRRGRLDSLGTASGPCPVTIRGVLYPSCSAAARALGVEANTVRAALRNGTLHRVGTGRVGPVPMRVMIAGKLFDDVYAAARHFDCKPGTVYSAIADGDPDRVARAPRYNPARARPFTVGGITFPSMRVASSELGFSNPEYVSSVIKRGSKRGRERILAAAMRYAVRHPERVERGGA